MYSLGEVRINGSVLYNKPKVGDASKNFVTYIIPLFHNINKYKQNPVVIFRTTNDMVPPLSNHLSMKL